MAKYFLREGSQVQ